MDGLTFFWVAARWHDEAVGRHVEEDHAIGRQVIAPACQVHKDLARRRLEQQVLMRVIPVLVGAVNAIP